MLRDVIQSDVASVVRLTEIFRQSADSRILTAAHAINRGEVPSLEAPPKGTKSDFYWFDRPEPEATLAMLCKMVARYVPERFGFDIQPGPATEQAVRSVPVSPLSVSVGHHFPGVC